MKMMTRFASTLSLLIVIFSMGGAEGGSPDLPVLKVKGNHFQIGLQTVGHNIIASVPILFLAWPNIILLYCCARLSIFKILDLHE
jgi:hypothetical protein